MLVQNTGNYVRHAAGVMILPGANDVKDSDWKVFSAHPLMEKLIEQGEIVAHEKAKGTKDLRADEAVTLVKDTFNPALLKEWQASEKRKGVLEAIAEQLESFNESKEEETE
ncbi:hypothetical protein [Priestia endophytica]|uniref:Uncharacterized protein n=1 Tax=Priestia endophytica TaxID=135735 RepID=A0AAX1Q5N6_9BACI|nr:hypothetical protein [Priestia endophytica]RAS75239.1 hypothetical protein A3864_16365 [Priestia endophytica]